MNTREEFGSYVLLKKLQDDALGETFRAGKMGPQGLDRVVLLRAFNGEGIDTAHLAKGLEARRPVQEILKSPNIGNGVDLGQVGNVPFVAYDYVSGTDLASLMVQSVKSRTPIPVDHALLIAERLALGLAVANENRVGSERITHGCLLPQLVILSSEGETRILGFEAGPSLREQAPGPIGEAVTRYVSPEALRGEALSRADDVYSLGVILFELLTGRTLPDGSIDIAVVEAVMREAGRAHLPTGVAALIQKSLAPEDERLPDAATWHKALSKMMVDAQLSPTTFNLAFFMHSLFRDQIEAESQELEVEKTLSFQAVTGELSHATTAIPMDVLRGMTEEAGAREGSGTTPEAVLAGSYPEPASSKKGIWFAAAAVVLAAVLGAVYWFYLRPILSPAAPETTVATLPPTTELADPLAAEGATEGDGAVDPLAAEGEAGAEGQSPEEVDLLRQQLDQILDEKTAAMEKSLKEQYDQRIRELQKTLDEAQRKAEASKASAAPAEPPVDAPAKPADPKPAAGTAQPTEPGADAVMASKTVPPPVGGAQGSAPAEGAQAPPAGNLPAGGQKVADATGTGAKPGGAAATADKPVEPQKPEVKPEPKPEPVRRGTLVTPGPGVVYPKLTRQATPRYPPMARQLGKTATVKVRVLVDDFGKVLNTELAEPKIGFGFDDAALVAARSSGFEPATKNGVQVKMWTVLTFKFD